MAENPQEIELDPLHFSRLKPVLEAAGMGLDQDEPDAEMERISVESGIPVRDLERSLTAAQETGLVLDDGPPTLLRPGRQLLQVKGEVHRDAVKYLAAWIDDLFAREALLTSQWLLMDNFRDHLLSGHGAMFTRDLVPAAFEANVDDNLALMFYAAAAGATTRLSLGKPPSCLAEELIIVELISLATVELETRLEEGRLTFEEGAAANESLSGIYELIGDDDVLNLFQLREPADAIVADLAPVRADFDEPSLQFENWFAAFAGFGPAGHTFRMADD